ncbi:MAG TPA: LPS assembly lipoprotein LptE [Bryobacteraceae bacterium]|nr:LPS assembly lipoprotein LptE [Bryobacteraceae bacterium]
MTKRAAFALPALIAVTVSCGYHVGGTGEKVPKSIQTIAIPAFNAFVARYALADELPQQIGREFKARTRFRIVTDPHEADAILEGTINSAFAFPTIYDPASGKATSVALQVNISVKLVEQRTGKVIYARPAWGFREDYELSVDPHQFFNESGPAQDRLCRDVARDLVSGIMEDF